MKFNINDNLKYWGVVERHVIHKYKITRPTLRVLLFFFREGYIARKDVAVIGKSIGFSMSLILSMRKKGLLISNKQNYRRRVNYIITPKGEEICRVLYNTLNGNSLMNKYKRIDTDPNELIAFRKEHKEKMIELGMATPQPRYPPQLSRSSARR